MTFTNLNVRNSTGEGILLTPAGGEVVFTQTGGVIENNAREGLRVQPGAGATNASTVTISSTEFRNNGAGPGGVARPGITIQARPATLTTVNVHDNVAGGLSVSSASAIATTTVTVSGTSHFDTNGTTGPAAVAGNGAGISGAGTTFTASTTTFTGNRGAGVHVGGGATATLHGGSYNGNGAGAATANGVEIESAGTVLLDRGAVVQNNVNSGLRTTGSGGVMTITGLAGTPIDVSNNGVGIVANGSGAWFANTTVTATNVAFHDNGRHGVQVDNQGLNPTGAPISITASTFTNNGQAGLLATVSEHTPTNANSLNVANNTFTGNLRGINVSATGGNVWASFQGNTISGNTDSGAYFTGTTNSNLNITGNTISNNRVAASSVFGGFGAGGVLFLGQNPSSGHFTLNGNLIHHNAQNQILVAAGTGGPSPIWDLSGTATAACVAASANTIACYNGVATPSSFVGIVAVGATVLANGNAWQNPVAPVNGTDFATVLGGALNPSPPSVYCPASTITCP